MPDKIKGVSYSHDASAESASSGPDYDDRVPLQDDLEYDPLSNYTAATTTSNDIKAFIRHVRRKSSERQSSLASSSYEPTPVNSLNISAVTDEGLNSEPEGTFSSGEENETGNEARDLPDDESGDDVHSEGGEEEKEEEKEEDGGGEDESHLKSMDSGFSESCKGGNEADRVEKAKSKVAADKEKTKVKDNHKISSEIIMKSDDTSLSPQDKKRKFKLKVDEKFSNDKKSVSKEDKLKKINGKESLDSVDCTRKRKLSAGDLSSFFQKRKCNILDGNTSSESLLTSKEDVKVQSLKKIEKLTKQKSQSTERNITSDISTSKDKTVTKKPQNAVLSENSSRKVDHTIIKKSQKQGKPFLAERKRSSDSSSGSNVDKTSVKKSQTLSSSEKQLHSKPKLSKNSSKVEPKKQVKIHKSTSVMQKGRPSNRLHQVSPKADNAKAKLSQLFGEDSSDDEEEVVEVNDSFAVSSDSDFDQDRRRESADVIIPKRSGTSASKVVSKNRVERHSKEAYDISSDSSTSKNSSLSNQHGKMEKKRTITKPRHGKYVKGVESSGMHEKRSSISKNSTNQKNHVEKKKIPPPGEFFRSCMGIRETEEIGNYVHNDSDASSDEVILITEDDEVQSPPKKIKKKPLSLDKQRPSTSNPSKVSKSEKVLSSKTPRPDKTNDSQRSRQSEVKKEPKDVSSSDEDFFVPVEEFDNEALFCDSDDLQDEDAYEECLQIFKENWNMIPQSEQKKRALKIEGTAKVKEPVQEPAAKRQAHMPKFDSRKVRKITKREKALPSPAQICHKRSMDAQKAALERSEREQKRQQEGKESFVKTGSQKRISHFHSSASLNGEKSRTPSSSKAPQKRAKTLAKTENKDYKRIAHIPSKVSKRPLLPTEYGSKVSTNVRQRYLNLFIDELLKTCKTDKAAFDKALAEEREVYDRASSRSIYLNLSVNALKRLRKGTGTTQPPSAPSNNRFAVSHQAVLGGKAATLTTFTLHRNSKTEQIYDGLALYEKLKHYLATEEQLVENGYPRPSEEPGRAVIKAEEKKKSSDPNQQVCCRCGKTFLRRPNGKYITKEQCVHHWGKLWTKRVAGSLESRYSCCSGDVQASGCGVTKCYTSLGLELTRVTVINDKLERVYDSLVKPQNEVVDYNTKFSGITEEDLETVKTTLQNVQAVLLSMFSSQTILIGHSLESDLLALKLIHSTVIDTALVFPHRRGPPYKRALRTITAEYLQKLFKMMTTTAITDQANSLCKLHTVHGSSTAACIPVHESGHDSMEDAKSCLELMIYKLKQDAKLRYQRR
ncbi:putative RNA exonuclease 1-like [Apostichopus japonicus]|uniref:Putative RNA exonuclease 1-like n=1 Tax=Stichopus japonicus TaxID=307972 RepID=A0A2G8JCR5_STIJA|nr:putative RNA exonuclease 1-like [Apostichopus japonicus]